MALVDPFAEPAQEVQPRQEQPKKPRLVDPFAKQTGLVDPWAPQQAPPPPEPPKKDYSYLESAGRNIKGGYAELASGLGTVSGYLGERLDSDTLRQTGESMKSYWDQVAEGAPPSQAAQVSPLDDPKVLADPKWWIENTARMAPSFAVPLGVGAGGMKIASKALPGLPRIATAIGAGVGGLFGGTIEGAQTYEEGLELGKDESTAATAGEAMALGSGVLNALPFYKIMNPAARGVIYNFITRGMTEGVTEAMEEPLDEIIQGLVYDKEMDWEEVARRAAHVAPPAFLLGGVGGAGGGRGASPEEGQPESIHATPEQSIEDALEEDADLTGGDTSTIQTEQDLAETETGIVEDASLTGEDALTEQVESEFGEELAEQSTAEVVPIEGEEIVMEGPAPEPPLQDALERQAETERGLTPAERQRTIQALEQELEPESAQAPISAPQTPQEAGKPVQPESPKDLDQAAQQAATSPQNKTPEPSPEAIEAGNYRKGHVKINGMDVSIENPKGSTRSGTNRKGKQWSRTLKDHYGYIRRSEAKDGEQVDVFLTDQAHDTKRPVFVVDQVDPETGRYDEPKAIMGARNEDQARRVYQRNYEDGWQGLGAITQMSQDEFKAWTRGDTTKPVALKEKPTRQPKAEAKPKAEEKEKPAPQKPGKAQQSDLIGQYVRSGSATGKVTAVSDDGKKATLDTGRRVPVGRAPNWAVQSEPFDGAKKRAAKEKAARKSSPPMFSVEQDPAETERLITALLDKDGSERVKALEMEGGPFGNVFDYQKNPDGLKKWYQQIAGRIHPDKVDHPRAEEAMAKLDQIRGEVAPSQEDLEKLRKGRERRAKKKAKKKASETRETDQGTPMFSVDTESDAFQRWFQNSAVVDENGEPLVVYHGTGSSGFGVFQNTQDIGFHFGTEQAAREVAFLKNDNTPDVYIDEVGSQHNVLVNHEVVSTHKSAREADKEAKRLRLDFQQPMAVYLSIQNPLRLPDIGPWYPKEIAEFANLNKKEKQQIMEVEDRNNINEYRGSYERLRKVLEEKGYDGIVYENEREDPGSTSYIAFRSEQIKSVDNRGTFSPTDPNILRSETAAQPRGMSAIEAHEQIVSRFGKKAIRKLEKSGRLTILNNPGQLDTRVRSRLFGENTTASPAGLHDPKTGKSWLFTDHISSGDAVGVFLHEVGAHYGLKRMIGAKEYRNVKKRLRDLANQGDKRVREAIFRVPEDTADEYFWDEALAYLVQHNYQFKDVPSANRAALKDPLVRALRKVVAQIRAFLNQLGFLNTRNLTSDDIVALVQGAARHAVRTAPKSGVQASQEATAMSSAPADTFYSQMARALNDKLPNKGTAQSYAKQIRNLAKKGQFKQEELEWSGVLEWLDNFKRTPSMSERMDEELLDIEAKRSKVVTKAEVLDFLRANRIQVEEVTKGGPSFADLKARFLEEGYDIEQDEQAGDTHYVHPTEGYIDFSELPSHLQVEVHKMSGSMDTAPKFANYQLPGGEGYRELLLTLPAKTVTAYRVVSDTDVEANRIPTREQAEMLADRYGGRVEEYQDSTRQEAENYTGTHFDEPNVLAHVRFNERTDADGNRVLFVEEVQSDWHQKGRKEGYKSSKSPQKLTPEEEAELKVLMSGARSIAGFYNTPDGIRAAELMERKEPGSVEGSVPDAPFKQTWPLLAMKRMIRYAAENGFDKVAWTTGAQQADRYDLSKQVESILVRPARGAGMGRMKTVRINTIKEARLEDPIDLTVNPDGKVVNSNKGDLMNKDLSDVIGKEMADKIMAVEEGVGRATFKGNDLKIGGEGMKAFYDKMLPSALNKYVKKWGAKVGDVTIPSQNRLEKSAGTVHALPITPQMREAVMEQGQPLFSRDAKLRGMASKKRGDRSDTPQPRERSGGITEAENEAYLDAVEKRDFEAAVQIVIDVTNRSGIGSPRPVPNDQLLDFNLYWRLDHSGQPLNPDFMSANQNDPDQTEEGLSTWGSLEKLLENQSGGLADYARGDVEIVAMHGDYIGDGLDGEPIIKPTAEAARFRHPNLDDFSKDGVTAKQMARDAEDIETIDDFLAWGWERVPEMDMEFDPVVYDSQGNVVPLSDRFNQPAPDTGALFSKEGRLTPEQKRERLRRLGLDFENLPGDLEGSQARATEPVDQEPDLLDPETALEELEKQGFDKPMLSVDDDGGEGTLNDPAQQERAQRSLTGNRVTKIETDEDGLVAEDPRLDPMSRDMIKLVGFFESATDKLRRSDSPILRNLSARVDAYYDRNEARMGWINGRVRPILKRIPFGKKKAVMRDFEEYWRHHDNGREQEASEVLNRNPIVRQLVTEVKGLYSEMGDLNQKVGVKVYDSSLNEGKGGWRGIGKVPKGKFWPRSFSPRVQRVLANPKNDPELWRQMVDALINEGHIETPAEASKYLRRYMGREVANDYFSGIEKARQRKLPEMFYDYSWDEFNRYARKWSSRVTQIEQFGQKTSQNTEDLFETVVNSTMDHHTQNYVAALSDHVYSRRSTDIYTTLLQHLNLIATGTQLGNPATATLNFIGGTTLNVQMFGWRRVAKSYATMMQDWKNIQQTGVDLGILGKDVLNILRDTEQSAATYMDASGRVQDSLARFAAFTMKWGGYKGTENIIRMNAMMSSWIQLQDALQQWNRNPTGSTSMKYRAFMQRNRINPDKLLAENGKGPETARYLRMMVNIPQGSYRPDMVPLYVDSPVGRFLFKYQKFGTQVSRMFWQNHLQPFVKTVSGGEKVLLPGQKLQKKTGNIIDEKTGKVVKSNRVRTFLPLLRYFAAALVGGSAILAARSFLFNYNDPGPEWDDLAAALDDEDEGEDRSLMWAMIFDRAYYSLFAASAAGFFGNYIQFLFDFADQQRVKNPLDPPGLASINAVQELVMRAVEQEGNLTARDLDNIGERTLALYRGYKRAGTKAMAMSGSGWKEARLRDAYTDLVYTKKMTRRFADEMDMKGRRTFSGRWGKTPMSPYNQQAYEALLLGDGASAEAVYQQAKQAMEEPGKVAQSMKSSMRARHPWNVGASQAKANHSKFLEWAEKHTSKANYQRIKALGDRYDRARKKAGL